MDSAGDFGVDFSADFGGLSDEIPFVELLAAPGGGDGLDDLHSLYAQPASVPMSAVPPSAGLPALATATMVQTHAQTRRSRRVRRRMDSASVAGDGSGSVDGEEESGSVPTTRHGKSQMRRLSHNASEKRRALKINTHIEELREIVEHHGMDVKKNKAAILDAAVRFVNDCVKEKADLERRVTALQSGRVSAVGGPNSAAGDGAIDYRRIFSQGCVPMAITTVDGRFLDCNSLFSHFSGFSVEELRERSIFTLTHPEDMQRTFGAVSELLAAAPTSTRTITKRCTMKTGIQRVTTSMSLVRDAHGDPSFFVCAVLKIVAEQPQPPHLQVHHAPVALPGMAISGVASAYMPPDSAAILLGGTPATSSAGIDGWRDLDQAFPVGKDGTEFSSAASAAFSVGANASRGIAAAVAAAATTAAAAATPGAQDGHTPGRLAAAQLVGRSTAESSAHVS